MKRWITGILALLMAAVFTACGNSGAEKPNTKDPADIARDIAAAEVLGDTLATAYENGLPMAEDWLDLYFMGSSDPGPERRTEIEAQYPTNEELLYGISAADADAAGWYDIWYAVHFHLWYAGSRGYEEYDDYGNYIGDGQANYGNHSGSEMISESRVKKINEVAVTQMATQWKNENNYSRPVSSKITTVSVRIFLADYRYSGSVVTATTEVEYWIGGGSPTGSVYATVVIDLYTGDVLSASIG